MIPDTYRAAAGFLSHVIRGAEVDQPEQVVGQSWVSSHQTCNFRHARSPTQAAIATARTSSSCGPSRHGSLVSVAEAGTFILKFSSSRTSALRLRAPCPSRPVHYSGCREHHWRRGSALLPRRQGNGLDQIVLRVFPPGVGRWSGKPPLEVRRQHPVYSCNDSNSPGITSGKRGRICSAPILACG
jgi:hypothetical protein